MIDDIFTEQEDSAIEQIKSLFYYPTTADIASQITNLIRSFDTDTRIEVIRTALIQLSFEQSERRRYIIAKLGLTNQTINIQDATLLVQAISQATTLSNASALLNAAGLGQLVAQVQDQPIAPDILEQAQIFNRVEESIDQYQASLMAQKNVGAIYTGVNRLSDESITALTTTIETYINQIKQLGENVFNSNPALSPAIVAELQKVGLIIPIQRLETFGEKLVFLSNVYTVAQAILTNRKQPTPAADNEVIQAVGLLLYYRSETPILDAVGLSGVS